MKAETKIGLALILLTLVLTAFLADAQDSNWVEVRGIKLFEVTKPYKSFSVERRVKIANTKLNKIATDPNLNVEELEIELNDDYEIIINGQTKIITVGSKDVTEEGVTRDQLAEQWLTQIEKGIIDAKTRYSNLRTMSRMILAVVLPVLFIILIWLLHWIFKKISQYFVKLEGEKITGVKVKEKQIISGRSVVMFFIKSLRIIKWILYIIAFYFFLVIFFNIFTPTKAYTQTLITISKEVGKEIGLIILAILKPVLGAILLIIIGVYIFKAINRLYDKFKEHEIEFTLMPGLLLLPIKRVLNGIVVIIIVFGILALIPGIKGLYLFIIFLLLLCFTFIALLRPAINLLSSLVILAVKPLQPGDKVDISGYKGTVKGIRILHTIIEIQPDVEAVVPNYLFLKNIFLRRRYDIHEDTLAKDQHEEDI